MISKKLSLNKIMKKQYSDFIQFYGLIAITIFFTYFIPSNIRVFWYVALLFVYGRSKDEPFWLALFLVISDGIMGFLGNYEATLSILPGLPAIEIGQFFVMIAFVKALYKKKQYTVFFKNNLIILCIYVLLLVFLGFYLGI